MRSYTVDQVAELESVNRETVLTWIRLGELTAHSASQNAKSRKPRWRVTDADLTAFRLLRQNGTAVQTPRRKRSAGTIKEYV